MSAGSVDPFWSSSAVDLAARLGGNPNGLTSDEAAARLRRFGPNQLARRRRSDLPALIFAQVTSPIVLIMLVATGLALCDRDAASSARPSCAWAPRSCCLSCRWRNRSV